jgi:ABC-type multidrug transport system fused ATPase/permease subunit
MTTLLRHLLFAERLLVAVVATISVAGFAAAIALPILARRAVDGLLVGQGVMGLGLYVVCALASVGLTGLQLALSGILGERVASGLRRRVLSYLVDADALDIERLPKGQLETWISRDVLRVGDLVSAIAGRLLPELLGLTGAMIGLWLLSPRVCAVAVGFSVIVLASTLLARARLHQAQVVAREAAVRTAGAAGELARHGPSFVGLGLGEALDTWVAERTQAQERAELTDATRLTTLNTVAQLILGFALAATIAAVLAGGSSGGGGWEIGIGAAAIETTFRLFGPLRELPNRVALVVAAYTSLREMPKLPAAPEQGASPPRHVVHNGGSARTGRAPPPNPPNDGGSARTGRAPPPNPPTEPPAPGVLVELRGAGLRTAEGAQLLKPTDLVIHAGECVALVGDSGSGKTTLSGLISGALAPTEGSVHLAPELTPKSITLIDQGMQLFSGSALDNIALDREANPERQKAALRRAWSGTPERLAQLLGGTPGAPSPGERLETLLARAIYREARLLVLDEPTASLDDARTQSFLSQVREALPGATIVIVTHRIRALREVDTLLVLRGGVVVERGPPAELLRMGGLFAQMHAHTDPGARK